MLFMLFLVFVIVGLAFFVGRIDGLGEARAESIERQINTLNARVEVFQWEWDKVRPQLIEKGIVIASHE